MVASSTGTLVLYLREKAQNEGRFDGQDTADLAVELRLAEEIMEAIRGENDGCGEGASIGAELRSGRTFSEAARLIRFAALRRLLCYQTLLDSINTIGYQPQSLRAALLFHWERLEVEPLGSDGNLISIDIKQAAEHAPEDYKEAVRRLMAGQGPQLIGEELEVNGSRLVGKALKYLSNVLEGRPTGQRKRSRRWKGPV